MITSTSPSHNTAGKIIETFIAGRIELQPIEFYDMPEHVLAKAGIYLTDTMPIDYHAQIVWDRQEVIVTIGDYIIASWVMGAKTEVVFNNSKGYGDMHTHSYIETLPVGIFSDIMGLLWPKL